MQTIRFSGRKPNPQILEIGMETDSGAKTLRFLVPQISDGQEATLQMILPDGTADALLLRDGMTVIPARIMEIAGTARAWVEILGSDTLAWHSEMLYLGIGETPEISGRSEQQYPTAFQDAMAQTLANKDAAADSAAAAEASATAAGAAADTAANSAAAAVVSAAHAANSASAAGASATVAANSASAAAASARKAEAMAGLTIDRTPTAGSINPVASGGVKTALDGKKNTQTAVSDPTASGTGVAFIDSITQNAQGVITPTKKTVQSASQSQAGLMSAADKTKLDGIAAGAQVNTLTGVKGSAENAYRTGNVNLTPANIGAASASHGNHVPTTETADNTKFLRNDNSWQKVTPANIGAKSTQTAVSDPTSSGNAVSFIDSISQNAQGVITPTKKTVPTMGAASASAAGTAGLVPAPAQGKQGQYLRGDGTWNTPTNTTYGEATTSASGLMSASDKTKLNGIATGATANSASSTAPKANGTASAGSESAFARGDHVHPLQTSVSGNAGSATAFNPTAIPANANLNTYTTPGTYYCPANATVATMTNCPTGNAFWMMVGKHAGTWQYLCEYMTSDYKMWTRNYYSWNNTGGWGSWMEWKLTDTNTHTITGVKGNAESSYRTGNVNLTAANIGAKAAQTAVSDPTASGTSATFIATISQNAQGVITPTKKTVQSASQSAAGLMSAADKTKLDGLNKANYLGNGTGYIYPYKNGGDAGSYNTEYHGFVFNMSGLPRNYGWLDVSKFDGSGFTPSTTGVFRQLFTHWNTGEISARFKIGTSGSWSNWRVLSQPIQADLGTITGTGSAVSITKTVTGVTDNMTADQIELGTPSAIAGDITIYTNTNSVTFVAAVNGSTTVKVKLSANAYETGT